MARVTVEDCLARIPNRFALTILASRRARALSENRGHALVDCENKEGVTALREISGDRVRFKEDVEGAMVSFIDEQRRQLRVTTGEHTFLEAASLRALEDEDSEEEDDIDDEIEELDTDPENLNKQAKGTVVEEDAEEVEDTETPDATEDEDFEPTEEDPESFADDIPDDDAPDLEDDSDDAEEEEGEEAGD
jgi:DNA-directed RNA polymerase subunit omega